MSHEETKAQPPATHKEGEQQAEKKTWVPPTVSESPVNDLTSAGFVGVGADNVIYS